MKLPACVLVMVRSGEPLMVVGSLAVLLPLLTAGSPPPEMFATFVTGEAAKAAALTATLSVMGFGWFAPAATTVTLVQVLVLLPTTVVEQSQLAMTGTEATVKPVGKLSTTVIVPPSHRCRRCWPSAYKCRSRRR